MKSLHFKIASGVILTILVLAALDFGVDYLLYRRQSVSDLQNYAANLSRITLRGILELAMLGRHPDLLQAAIERLVEEQPGENPPLKDLMLIDPEGNVRFSSRPGQVGVRYRSNQTGCRECHEPGEVSPPASRFIQLGDEEVLRSFVPVPNRHECQPCHDPARAINGFLVIDLSLAAQRAEMNSLFVQMLLKTGLTVLAILGVLGLLLRKIVIRRVERLTVATDQMARQTEVADLSDLAGRDEISQLASSFARMYSKVTASIRELQAQQRYLQDLVDSLQDGLVVVSSDFRVEMTNLRATQVWKENLAVGIPLADTPLSDSRTTIMRTFREARMERGEIVLGGPEGFRYLEVYCSPIWDHTGTVVRVIVLFRDVTERRMFERQMNRAERLASLGQLAAGLAHEVNNPMAAITTCAEGLGRYLDSEVQMSKGKRLEVQDYLETIGEAALRCKEITQRLLNLSADRGELELQEVKLNELVRQSLKLVGHQAQAMSIEIEEELCEGTVVLGDWKKLYQLILNLMLNSIEAINGSGRILISARQIGELVELSVQDDGCGIAKENLKNLFDPFFTTKSESRGTGLGLSICEHIVRQHQGQISVESQLHVGTRVIVLLPAYVRPNE